MVEGAPTVQGSFPLAHPAVPDQEEPWLPLVLVWLCGGDGGPDPVEGCGAEMVITGRKWQPEAALFVPCSSVADLERTNLPYHSFTDEENHPVWHVSWSPAEPDS